MSTCRVGKSRVGPEIGKVIS
jgi:hypothetical protein